MEIDIYWNWSKLPFSSIFRRMDAMKLNKCLGFIFNVWPKPKAYWPRVQRNGKLSPFNRNDPMRVFHCLKKQFTSDFCTIVYSEQWSNLLSIVCYATLYRMASLTKDRHLKKNMVIIQNCIANSLRRVWTFLRFSKNTNHCVN